MGVSIAFLQDVKAIFQEKIMWVASLKYIPNPKNPKKANPKISQNFDFWIYQKCKLQFLLIDTCNFSVTTVTLLIKPVVLFRVMLNSTKIVQLKPHG